MSNLEKTRKPKSEIVVNMKIHSNAKNLILEKTESYSVALVYEAKNLAFTQGSDEVQTNHVKDALLNITERKKKNWPKEIVKILGGSLFGVFIPGFIAALNPVSIFSIVIYTIIGFTGMFLIFFGIIE